MQPFLTTFGRKLKLLQIHDPLKQWWSLDETRCCGRCHHLFLGRDIKLSIDQFEVVHFRCPTFNCNGGFLDWKYPDLHL